MKNGLDAILEAFDAMYGHHLDEDLPSWLKTTRASGHSDQAILDHILAAHESLVKSGLAAEDDDLAWVLRECQYGGCLWSHVYVDFQMRDQRIFY